MENNNNNNKLKKNAYLRNDGHVPSAYELQLINIIKEQDEINFALNEHAIVAITDVRGIIIECNDKFCLVSQYSNVMTQRNLHT